MRPWIGVVLVFAFGVQMGTKGANPLRARADSASQLAGLVVQGQDGQVQTYCLDLQAESRSGMELLRLARLEVSVQSFGPGVAVCSIGGEGCAYPAESCWCECRSLSGGCSYWAYHSLEDGAWRYSALGPTGRQVKPGDVDGWAWGPGTLVAGTTPPLISFDEICEARRADPRPELPPTPTVEPGTASTTVATRAPRTRSRPSPTPATVATAGTGTGAGAGPGSDERSKPDDDILSSGNGSPGDVRAPGRDDLDSQASPAEASAPLHPDSEGGDPSGGETEGRATAVSESAPALALGEEAAQTKGGSGSDSSSGKGDPSRRASRAGQSAESAAERESNSMNDSASPDDRGTPAGRKAQLDLLAFFAVLGLLGAILIFARRA